MPSALIWGASGGIGSALVNKLAADGWTVLGAARDESRVPEGASAVFEFDARKPYSFDHVAMMAAQETTGIDLVVYAAGMIHAQQVDNLNAEAWAEVIDVNLNGASLAARASLPLMTEGGHFIAIGAQVEKLLLPKFAAYTAAKVGLQSLIAILQKENRRMKFSLIRPGAVDTAFWQHVPFSLPKQALTPGQVADAIAAQWVAGQSGTTDL